jgi:hypothetical protein
MSSEVRRKRPWWFRWLPTLALVLAIGVVVATAATLLRGGIAEPAPRATEGQVTELNWSIFTQAGLAYIDRSRQVRIDFADAPVEAAPLGLPDDGTLTIGPKSSGDVELDYGFIASGGGRAPGGAKFIVTQLTITTRGGVIESVTAPLREVLNFRQTLDALLERAEIFGWETSGTTEVFELVERSTRDGVPYEFTFGPADRVGVPIAATPRCEPSGYCLVEYAVTPSVR